MADPLVIQMLKTNIRYQSQRQGELARNVSNIDTPGYHARDLKKLDFAKMVASSSTQDGMTVTSEKHMQGTLGGGVGRFAGEKVKKPFEVSPTDNNVVLEEEMAKVNDTATQFELSTALLKKYSGMYKIAIGNHN